MLKMADTLIQQAMRIKTSYDNIDRGQYEVLGNTTNYPLLSKLPDLILLGDDESERICNEYGIIGFLSRTDLITEFTERTPDNHRHACRTIHNGINYRGERLTGVVMGVTEAGKYIIHFFEEEFPPFNISPSAVLGLNVTIGPGVIIGDKARISSGTVIGPGVKIGNNVTIGASVRLGKGLKVGDGVEITDSDLNCRGYIQDYSCIHNTEISDGVCYIGSHCRIGQEGNPFMNDRNDRRTFIQSGLSLRDGASIMGGCRVGYEVSIGAKVQVTPFTVLGNEVHITEGNYYLPRGTYEQHKFVIWVRPETDWTFSSFMNGNTHFPTMENVPPLSVNGRVSRNEYLPEEIDGFRTASFIGLWNEEKKDVDFIHTGAVAYNGWENGTDRTSPVESYRGMFATHRIVDVDHLPEPISSLFGGIAPVIRQFLIGMNRPFTAESPAIYSPGYFAIPESLRLEKRNRCMEFCADDIIDQAPPVKRKTKAKIKS